MRRIFSFIILTCIATFLFSSCGDSGSLVVDDSDSTVAQLVGPTWKLITIQDDSEDKIRLNDNETYTIKFGPNEGLQGAVDCNSYAANYSAEDGGQLSINAIRSTEAYCGEESHDDTFIGGIQSAKEYEVSSDQLRIGFERYGALIFERIEAGQ